jgi:uncharacterized protein YjdB
MSSCSKGTNPTGNDDGYNVSDINKDSLIFFLNLRLNQASSILTRAYNLVDVIHNVNVFVYGAGGQLLYHQYYATSYGIQMFTSAGTKTIVVIANAGNMISSLYGTLESLRTARQTEIPGTNSSIVYAAEVTKTLFNSDRNIDITIKRLLSKLTFVFDKSALDPGTSITISGIQLKNVPGSCFYIMHNTPALSDIVAEGDYLSDNLEPANHESASPLYMFENKQGTIGTSTNPMAKSPGAKSGVCSYAEITANYSNPQKTGTVKYRIYLGENTTTSFDVIRETHYLETIRLTGAGISNPSWMVDIEQLNDVTYTITATASPIIGGTVSGGGKYRYNVTPDLIATPAANYIFTGWTPAISAVRGNQHYTANFLFVEIPVNSITVTPSILNFSALESSSSISGSYLPVNATSGTAITYSSSNTAVAVVNSASGVVTSKGWGSCTITALSSNGKSASCIIYVTNPEILVNNISVSLSSTSLTIGSSTEATAIVTPVNASNKGVNWSSSNTSVATVSGSGYVTATGVGICNIIATAKDGSGVTGSAQLTAVSSHVPVTGVNISENSAQIEEGYIITLAAFITPANATNKGVVWSSSNTSVATVNGSGMITTKGRGTTIITVTTEDGGYSATCTLNVYSVIWVKPFIGSRAIWDISATREIQREYIFYAKLETDDMNIVQQVAPYVEVSVNYQLRALQNYSGTVTLNLNSTDNNADAWDWADQGRHDLCAYIGILDRDTNDESLPHMNVYETATITDGSLLVGNYMIKWNNSRLWGYDRR